MDPVIACMLGSVFSLTLLATLHRRCFSANGTHQHSCEELLENGSGTFYKEASPFVSSPLFSDLAGCKHLLRDKLPWQDGRRSRVEKSDVLGI